MTCLSSNRTHSHALYPKKKYSKLDTLAPNVPPLFLITPACRDCVHDGSTGFQVLSTRPSQAAMKTNSSQRASRARMDMRSCRGDGPLRTFFGARFRDAEYLSDTSSYLAGIT